jgi:hypothetical protein
MTERGSNTSSLPVALTAALEAARLRAVGVARGAEMVTALVDALDGPEMKRLGLRLRR